MAMNENPPQLVALLRALKRRLKESDILFKWLNNYRPGVDRELRGIIKGNRPPTERSLAAIAAAFWEMVQNPGKVDVPKKRAEAMWKSLAFDLRGFAPNQNSPVSDEESLRSVLYAT